MVTQSPIPGSRGTIIVDRSLIRLAAPMAYEYRQQAYAVQNYVDLLTALAKEGYRILVPEIAALQTGMVFADGTNMSGIFDRGNKLAGQEKILAPFFAAAGKHETAVTIVPEPGPQEVDRFCAHMRRIVDQHSVVPEATVDAGGRRHHIQKHRTAKHQDIVHNRLRDALTAEWKQQPEAACTKSVRALILRCLLEGEAPIVLTDNRLLKEELDGRVNTVTSGDFIAVLSEVGFCKHLGIDASTSDLVTDQLKARQEMDIQTAQEYYRSEDKLPRISIPQMDKGFFDHIHALPLYHGMKAVMQDIEQRAAAPKEQDAAALAYLERFRNKFKSYGAGGTPGGAQQSFSL